MSDKLKRMKSKSLIPELVYMRQVYLFNFEYFWCSCKSAILNVTLATLVILLIGHPGAMRGFKYQVPSTKYNLV